jgi:hypothetical protein
MTATETEARNARNGRRGAGRGIAAARLSWTTTVETTRKSLTVL